MGKYQFGKSTLKGLGFEVIPVKNSLTTHNYKKKQ